MTIISRHLTALLKEDLLQSPVKAVTGPGQPTANGGHVDEDGQKLDRPQQEDVVEGANGVGDEEEDVAEVDDLDDVAEVVERQEKGPETVLAGSLGAKAGKGAVQEADLSQRGRN